VLFCSVLVRSFFCKTSRTPPAPAHRLVGYRSNLPDLIVLNLLPRIVYTTTTTTTCPRSHQYSPSDRSRKIQQCPTLPSKVTPRRRPRHTCRSNSSQCIMLPRQDTHHNNNKNHRVTTADLWRECIFSLSSGWNCVDGDTVLRRCAVAALVSAAKSAARYPPPIYSLPRGMDS
jgi:hypothetical protein